MFDLIPGEKELEQQVDEQDTETNQDLESAEQSTADASAASHAPKENEIKELDQDHTEEHPCLECGEVTLCKYTLFKAGQLDEGAADDDIPAIARPGLHYLCRVACLNAFKETNPDYKLVVKRVAIYYAVDTQQTCCSCADTKVCRYRFKEASDAEAFDFLCEDACLNKYTAEHPEKFVIAKRRFIVEELTGGDLDNAYQCLQCTDQKKCKYTFKQDDDSFYLCEQSCLNLLMAEQPDRYRIKRQSIRVKVLPRSSMMARPSEAKESAAPESSDTSAKMVARTEDESRLASLDREASFSRRCGQCYSDVLLNERTLQWEAMDFCNETCLRQYQSTIGAACHTCQNAVSVASMGKYCVRFGFELRQFCRSTCLDTFKRGLKVCSHCQIDISKNKEFLASVNGQFKGFCSRDCMRAYELIFNIKKIGSRMCAVCNNTKLARAEVVIDAYSHFFCSNPCLSAFKFVNNINPGA